MGELGLQGFTFSPGRGACEAENVKCDASSLYVMTAKLNISCAILYICFPTELVRLSATHGARLSAVNLPRLQSSRSKFAPVASALAPEA